MDYEMDIEPTGPQVTVREVSSGTLPSSPKSALRNASYPNITEPDLT